MRIALCLSSQRQEGRLKRILGILVLPQHVTAHAHDHRAVADHQGPERLGRFLGVAVEKPVEELVVTRASVAGASPHRDRRG